MPHPLAPLASGGPGDPSSLTSESPGSPSLQIKSLDPSVGRLLSPIRAAWGGPLDTQLPSTPPSTPNFPHPTPTPPGELGWGSSCCPPADTRGPAPSPSRSWKSPEVRPNSRSPSCDLDFLPRPPAAEGPECGRSERGDPRSKKLGVQGAGRARGLPCGAGREGGRAGSSGALQPLSAVGLRGVTWPLRGPEFRRCAAEWGHG